MAVPSSPTLPEPHSQRVTQAIQVRFGAECPKSRRPPQGPLGLVGDEWLQAAEIRFFVSHRTDGQLQGSEYLAVVSATDQVGQLFEPALLRNRGSRPWFLVSRTRAYCAKNAAAEPFALPSRSSAAGRAECP